MIVRIALLGVTLGYGLEPLSSHAAGEPDQALNYSYLYYENGFPTPLYNYRRPQSEANTAARANPDLVMQTGYYSLMLDCDDVQLKGFDALAGSDYLTALHEDVTTFSPASLLLRVYYGGVAYDCTSGVVEDGSGAYVRLIESGQYVQRFDHLGLEFRAANNDILPVDGRLEVTVWPDRVVFLLDFTGTGVTRTTIEVVSPASTVHLADTLADHVTLALQPHADLKLSNWTASSYIVEAKNLQNNAPLAYHFDDEVHAIHIDVPADSVSYPSAKNRVDEYLIEVTNPTAATSNIPLVFDQVIPRAITGTIMILAEESDGRPVGIPVQISKNWHKDAGNPTVHEGSWLRGSTMIPLAPGENRRFKLRVVYGYWAGAGAISHAQLSLIGWSDKNWKWDESALGSWGESCTYDPALHAGAAFMDDIRPSFTTAMSGGQHNWTENVGGGDNLIYRDSANKYRWIKRLKTAYHWTGPNMTEVLYSGVTDDDRIRVTYTSRAVRTMDYHRRFHGYKYEFLQNVTSPRRLVFHQMAADYYLGPTFTDYYIGDGTGLLSSLVSNPGGNTYKGSPVPFSDKWLAVDDTIALDGNSVKARRGILSLSSTLNGSAFPSYLHTYGRTWGSSRMLFDLSSDSVTRSYTAGDVVEGELEFILPPKWTSDYWGDDAEFIARLGSYSGNAWQAVHDEFRYNAQLGVSIHEGTLLRDYPVEIEASSTSGSVLADFTINSGGIGHVPVVLKGVETGLALQAQRWSGGAWVAIDTADVNENNDYQGYSNADGTMDVVFNITRPSMNPAESWRIRIVSGSSTALHYADWIFSFGVSETNLAPTANPDNDSLNNLYEFGLGGDPTNELDVGYVPELRIIERLDDDWLEYTYAKRNDAAEVGLTYYLEHNFSLTNTPAWTNANYEYQAGAPDSAGPGYGTVTNWVNTTLEDAQFLRLHIEEN